MSADKISDEDVELVARAVAVARCTRWGYDKTLGSDAEAWRIDQEVDPNLRADVAVALAALAGRLLPAGGQAQTIWRARNLVSDGAVIGHTREYAERFMHEERAPYEPASDPHVLETATQTTYPDGSVLTGPWVNVEEGS
jgi:hypothetical protein